MCQNFQTIYKNLPYSVRGFTVYDGADDFYTIVINCRYGFEAMKKTFYHELNHINRKDIYSTKSIEEIECENHKEKSWA